jgi:D-ribose pyranose/furanose isomerase RbsD
VVSHPDLVVIADAGLLVSPGMACIELEAPAGVPRLLDLHATIAAEFEVKGLTSAGACHARDVSLPTAIRALYPPPPRHTRHARRSPGRPSAPCAALSDRR